VIHAVNIVARVARPHVLAGRIGVDLRAKRETDHCAGRKALHTRPYGIGVQFHSAAALGDFFAQDVYAAQPYGRLELASAHDFRYCRGSDRQRIAEGGART
jgi:hypothetical protein